MGKYDGIVDKLPRIIKEEPDYQAKVEDEKRAILASPDFQRHGSVLGQMLYEARIEKEVVDEEMYKVNLRITALQQLLVDQFEVEGVTSMKLAHGTAIRIQYEPYAKVVDPETFRVWCIENGYESLMKLQWQTTNGIVKEKLVNGEDVPPGITAHALVKVFVS